MDFKNSKSCWTFVTLVNKVIIGIFKTVIVFSAKMKVEILIEVFQKRIVSTLWIHGPPLRFLYGVNHMHLIGKQHVLLLHLDEAIAVLERPQNYGCNCIIKNHLLNIKVLLQLAEREKNICLHKRCACISSSLFLGGSSIHCVKLFIFRTHTSENAIYSWN